MSIDFDYNGLDLFFLGKIQNFENMVVCEICRVLQVDRVQETYNAISLK